MASEKTPDKSEGLEHQDQSIKARKTELYEDSRLTESGSRKPFKVYLGATPASPLSTPVKASLLAVAVLVVLLLLAALFSGGGQKRHSMVNPPKSADGTQRI